MAHKAKHMIGRQEWCCLPELKLEHIRAKVDTGAATSALHAENIRYVNDVEGPHVSFLVRPFADESQHVQHCKMPVKDVRNIMSSNGKKERRYVIETLLKLGPIQRRIELTLTDRSLMRFNLLLGREALSTSVIIDPSKAYLLGL